MKTLTFMVVPSTGQGVTRTKMILFADRLTTYHQLVQGTPTVEKTNQPWCCTAVCLSNFQSFDKLLMTVPPSCPYFFPAFCGSNPGNKTWEQARHLGAR